MRWRFRSLLPDRVRASWPRWRQGSAPLPRSGGFAWPGAGALGAILLVSCLAPAAWGWGRMAHRASAKLAESRLSPAARAAIRDLLEPGESLADASTWADDYSREVRASARWHYVNVPITAAHYTPRDCRPGGCVVSKIAEFRAILLDRNAPRTERRKALRFFVHLVQDLHQPMHVADRNDRGGNNVQLRYGRYDNTNLHQVWDSGLLHQGFRHENQLVHAIEELATGPSARDWLQGRVEDWADESLEVGRLAYAIPGSNATLRSGSSIGRDYERDNLPRAVDRVARSGVRLAALLNKIFE